MHTYLMKNWNELIAFAIAAISAGIGGCAVASYFVLHGQKLRTSYMIAYCVIGIAFGLIGVSYGKLMGINFDSIELLIGHTLLIGAFGAALLASANLSARFIFRKLGWEIDITLRKTNGE